MSAAAEGAGSLHHPRLKQSRQPQDYCSGPNSLAHIQHLLCPLCPAVVTVHMLRGDAAGRSFFIRVHDEVAATNLAAARAAVVAGQAAQGSGPEAGSPEEAAAACPEAQPAARMYFWLAEPALGPAVDSLGRLKSRECAGRRAGVGV